MTVLMSKKKADAIAAAGRDRHLLTDRAALERVNEADGGEPDLSVLEDRFWLELRMKAGR